VVDGLLRRNPAMRVLFVEPPTDVTACLRNRTLPRGPVLRRIGDTGRLWGLRPVKALPRSAGSWADRSLGLQVRLAARRLGFGRPVLWVNDLSYAWLVRSSGWPSIYDITDDWLLEPGLADHELSRRQRLDDDLVRLVAEVVVCSPALARSRSAARPVNLIPNGVDVDHFTTPGPGRLTCRCRRWPSTWGPSMTSASTSTWWPPWRRSCPASTSSSSAPTR
jgi:hypothetical protein